METWKIERCIEALHALESLRCNYSHIREVFPQVREVAEKLRMALEVDQMDNVELFLIDLSKAICDVTLKYQPLIEKNLKAAAK